MAFGQRVMEGSGLGPRAWDFVFGKPGTAAWAKQNCISFVDGTQVMTTGATSTAVVVDGNAYF